MIKGTPCEVCGSVCKYDDGRCIKCKRHRNKLQREIARDAEDQMLPDAISGKDDIKLSWLDNQKFLVALWNEKRRTKNEKQLPSGRRSKS